MPKKAVHNRQKNDNRVTAFGKFLRKTRLDEIPQFINILNGDMSLIGRDLKDLSLLKNWLKQFLFIKLETLLNQA